MRHAEAAGIPRDTPWYQLTPSSKKLGDQGITELERQNWNQQWYGIQRFFDYLESKAYKMHIRVLLSKYRSYTPCPVCLRRAAQDQSLLWRIGLKADADAVLEPVPAFMPQGAVDARAARSLPGLCLHDLMLLPSTACASFELLRAGSQNDRGDDAKRRRRAQALPTPKPSSCCSKKSPRLKYLCDVGIGYLTLDRQSRTLSGRRGAAHQPHHGPGHQLVNTCSCWTAQHRPAPARHAPHRRGHAAPARCRQHPGGGGARPRRHAGGRPHDRHGPRPRRARAAASCSTAPRPTCATPTRSPAPTWAGASAWAWASRMVTDHAAPDPRKARASTT